MEIDECLVAVLEGQMDPDVMVRVIAGRCSAEDEALLGVSAQGVLSAAQASAKTWHLARKVVNLSGGSLGHARGNPLPAAACGRLGIPPPQA